MFFLQMRTSTFFQIVTQASINSSLHCSPPGIKSNVKFKLNRTISENKDLVARPFINL